MKKLILLLSIFNGFIFCLNGKPPKICAEKCSQGCLIGSPENKSQCEEFVRCSYGYESESGIEDRINTFCSKF